MPKAATRRLAIHAVVVWVERATGPFCRATSPTAERSRNALSAEESLRVRLVARLPPGTARLAVPPKPKLYRLGWCREAPLRLEFKAESVKRISVSSLDE